MKTIQIPTILKTLTLAACMLVAALPQVQAQQASQRKVHFAVDWQMNAPLSTGFADKISGWGMNFEGAYDVTSHFSAGAFLSFHTNHRYIDRQTISLSPTESLTTDQQRSAFQLPFGATAAYTFCTDSHVRPYVGAKLGAMFARNTTYFGTGGLYDTGWGFYASPEIGLKIYPNTQKNWGFHIAGFYSYATNRTETLTGNIDGQSNAGFRLGILF
ncbi:outer membrane beta-barrel protein [uncultured Mediterranea sp.]|uniref:outer membrane beta-barrel protein n=1 Tax=uncultured Mediterranea sp. TaxID=1926662 RepID=UPI0027D9A30F|nr:outer membrane beta-barrel protein [uncultured Mediterranea sp.]